MWFCCERNGFDACGGGDLGLILFLLMCEKKGDLGWKKVGPISVMFVRVRKFHVIPRLLEFNSR